METGDLQSSNEKLKEYCKELKQKIPLNNSILFVNCPQFNLNTLEIDVAKNRGYYAYPPTGLQYLSAALENRGLNIKIFDLNYEFLKRINSDKSFNSNSWISLFEEYIDKNNPSIIGISNLFYVDAPYFKEISKFLKNRKEKHIILVGGQNATYNTKKFLEENLCNFVCERESENKINFLFDYLYQNEKHKATPGILFEYKGQIERTEGESDIVKLNGNLINSHKLLNLEDYCKVGSLSPYSRMAGKDTPFAGILLNRGCRGGCKFCDVIDYVGRGIRSRDNKDFLDEMQFLYEKKGIKFFEILDDDFTSHKNNALKALRGIKDRNLNIKWASTNGIIARTLDEELMGIMRDSGCIGFHIGVESGNPQILKKMHKPGTLDRFKKFSRIAQKFPEMFIIDNYIIGLPNETFGEIMDSFNFSKEMNLDWSNYTCYQQNISYSDSEKNNRENIEDFLPGKNVFEGKLYYSEKILTGPDIFNILPDITPSREQLNHIWFAFDLVRNYIFNKNIMPNAVHEKFISWGEAIQERYPTQAHLPMFISLAYLLRGNQKKAEEYYEKTTQNLKNEYWSKKFNEFELIDIVNNFPRNKKQSEETLNFLRKKYEK